MEQILVFHCRLDHFFISIARQADAGIANGPLLLGDDNCSERARVMACCTLASASGVKEGMPLRQALALCPQAVSVPFDYEAGLSCSAAVMQLMATFFPVVEQTAPDACYMTTGTPMSTAAAEHLLRQVRQALMARGLEVRLGAGINKTVAALASAAAEEVWVVGPEQSIGFLATVPVRKLPAAAPNLHRQLIGMGITHAGRLQQMDQVRVRKLLGPAGLAMWELANGIDRRPVMASGWKDRKSCTMQLRVIESQALQLAAGGLPEQLAAALQESGLLCGGLRLSVAELPVWEINLSYTQQADRMAAALAQYAERKPILLKAGEYQLRLEATNLVTGSYQIDLFSDMITGLNGQRAVQHVACRIPAQLTAMAS